MSTTLKRTTIRLTPDTIKILKQKSLQRNTTIQQLIENAILAHYSDLNKGAKKKTGVHQFNLGISGKITRQSIYDYLDEKL